MAGEVDAYAAKQARVADTARRVFTQWLAANPTAADFQVRERLIQITMSFGDAAAELAVEYYMQQRDLVPGLSAWEAQAYVDDPSMFFDSILKKHVERREQIRALQERMGLAVQQSGRKTITRNARRDPAGPRWARMPVGKTCARCLMFASRGAVYFTKHTAGDTGHGTNWYHSNCNCQVVPVWKSADGKYHPPYDAEELYDMYRKSWAKAGGKGVTGEQVAEQIRRDYPDLVSDGVYPEGMAPSSAKAAAGVVEQMDEPFMWKMIQNEDLSDASWESDELERMLGDAMESGDTQSEQFIRAELGRRSAVEGKYRGTGFTVRECRAMWHEHIEAQYLDAEAATNGYLLSREGRAAGVTARSLFKGPEARAYKYASDELKYYWQEHPRLTFDAWVGDAEARARAGSTEF